MRGHSQPQPGLILYFDPQSMIPEDEPLRAIRPLVDSAIAGIGPVLETMYSHLGRPSIPPERLLKASLLMALFSIPSERAFCRQLSYNLLYRWFLDMNLDEKPFSASSFSKNRQRLMQHEVGQALFDQVICEADERGLLSHEHFSVDGTLIEAAASMRSFRPRDEDPPRDQGRNPQEDYRGQKRRNDTHRSSTDPQARLIKKSRGDAARLCYMAHGLMENRNGLLIDLQLSIAGGKAERDQVPLLIEGALARGFRPRTLGADKGYDESGCVQDLRRRGITPHVAAKKSGGVIDGRTTRHETYRVSQRKRKLIEETFGWLKTVGGLRRSRYVGLEKTSLAGYLAAAAYNLVRISNLPRADVAACPA